MVCEAVQLSSGRCGALHSSGAGALAPRYHLLHLVHHPCVRPLCNTCATVMQHTGDSIFATLLGQNSYSQYAQYAAA